MSEVGNFSLIAIIVLASYALIASLIGARRRLPSLALSGERAMLACAAFSTVSVASLWTVLLRSDFRYQYVASYSSRDLPLFYKVAAMWAGNDGSLLFWSWLIFVCAAIAIVTNRRANRELMPYVVATLSMVTLFFTYMNYWICNPFGLLALSTPTGVRSWAPVDGQGLNPLLQHPIMAIHPPILYVGYVSFVIPFAFCVAALWLGKLDSDWIKSTRRWTLTSWFFLGTGILLGARWAYVELGWGGYWAWDPVENAALMPWLMGTAYLHSVMIQERRGMLKIWNVVLVLATYSLCVLGTFLTRSGIVSSVHAFAESDFAWRFLAYIVVVALACSALLIYRIKQLGSDNELDSMVSREAGFVFNNLLFVVACFSVLWGTLFPVLSEAVQGEKVSVGAPFFNKVNIPIALVLLALTGIGPLLAWRKTSASSLKRYFWLPSTVGVVVGFALLFVGIRHVQALVCFALSAFVLTTILQEFHRGTLARRRQSGAHYLRALLELVRVNTRRYGGYVVHFGMVLLFIGAAGSAFDTDKKVDMNPGDEFDIRSYRIRYQGVESSTAPTYRALSASIELSRRKSPDAGLPLGTFTPARHIYLASQQPTSEVSRYSTFVEDVYIVFAGMNEAGKATIQVYVNPLVRWVWIGGIVVFLGTCITMVPSRRELSLASRQRPSSVAVGGRVSEYDVA